MAKLDRSGIASRCVSDIVFFCFGLVPFAENFTYYFCCSVAGSLGVPGLNGSAPAQQSINMALGGAPAAIPTPVLPAQLMASMVPEPIGNPSECLLLKNMFDPGAEVRI